MGNIAGAKVSIPISMKAAQVPATIAPFDWWFDGALIPSNSPFWTYATSPDKIGVVDASTGLEVVRYIENFDYSAKRFCLWGSGGAAQNKIYYVQSGPTVSKVNSSSVFGDSCCVARWGFNESSGALLDSLNAYNGSPVAMAGQYQQPGKLYKSIGFNGINSNFDCGDITQLNSASKASFLVLLSQDVLGAIDNLYMKGTNYNTALQTYSDNKIYVYITSSIYGYFTYTSYVTANEFFLLQVVFDGTQSTNSERLKCYINGSQIALSYSGTIPATLSNLPGQSFTWGTANLSLGGRIDEGRVIVGSTISANQALLRYNNWFQNDFWTVGNASLLSSRRSSGGLGIGIGIGL